MTAAPKLRDDLVIRHQATRTGKSVVVKDPTARRFFRFGEVEHFIAQQLDGATPLDVVRERVEERFGQGLPEQTLRRFIEQFRRFRLLDDGTEREQHVHQRVGGSFLYLRVKAFDPDRFLDWLLPRVRVVFTPAFIALSAAAILVALVVTAANWPQFTRDVARLYRFDALLVAWITVLTVTSIHELAHGVTCKRFGGQVNEIGFLLLYLQPAFFCNVSDSWLFPEKSKRLWIMFAGAYSEMLVWALATLAWQVTEADTWVNFVALIVMATSGVKTLFNLNPLIKLDGYYLLSDYLEIPNLRQKSVAAIKARVRGLWNWSADAWRVHGREEWIYLGYGALATVYSTWFMTLIAWRFGSYLTTRYRGFGFIVFVGLLLMVFRRPLGNVLSLVKRTPDPATSAPGSKMPRGLRPAAIAVALVAIALIPAELKVSGDFRVLPAHNGEVRAQIDGILAEIYRDEGDHVEQGEPIARLDDREYTSGLQKVDAQIAQAEARRNLLQQGPRREEVDLARMERDSAKLRQRHGEQMFEDAGRFRAAESAKLQTSIEKAEQRLAFARGDRDRIQRLFASALVARKTVEEAEQEVNVREKELEEARSAAKMVLADDSAEARKERDITAQEFGRAAGQLRVLMAGSRPEELAAAEAEIARLRAERTYLEQQRQLARAVSPTAGVIATAKLKDRIGQRVSRGDLIASVYDQTTLSAEIMVSEKEIADISAGQTVVVKARAFPDRIFTSRITAIAPVAVEDPGGLGGRMIRVMTDIDNRSHLLKPEMSGTAKIYCGSGRVFDVATRRIARYVRVEFWSWW